MIARGVRFLRRILAVAQQSATSSRRLEVGPHTAEDLRRELENAFHGIVHTGRPGQRDAPLARLVVNAKLFEETTAGEAVDSFERPPVDTDLSQWANDHVAEPHPGARDAAVAQFSNRLFAGMTAHNSSVKVTVRRTGGAERTECRVFPASAVNDLIVWLQELSIPDDPTRNLNLLFTDLMYHSLSLDVRIRFPRERWFSRRPTWDIGEVQRQVARGHMQREDVDRVASELHAKVREVFRTNPSGRIEVYYGLRNSREKRWYFFTGAQKEAFRDFLAGVSQPFINE